MSESQEEYANEEKPGKFNNTVPFWGNEASMNLNSLILTNIQSSTYFKVSLFKLKTYHEVIDEIYYQVKHMEPWEKGSRKTSGQTGMCGGVRGVGAGGIVSSAFCLLYKLYTLRLTRKQLNGLLNHTDSPYIRALGFMYIRYTQPPADLYSWYEEYLSDEEEIDVKAGGGQLLTIGQMIVQFLTKLDWCGTLFPRIPVPIQKQIQTKLEQYAQEYGITLAEMTGTEAGANNNKHQHGQRGGGGRGGGRQGGDYGGGGGHYEDKSRNNYDNNRGGAGEYNRGGGGGAGTRRRDEDGGRNRYYDEDRDHSSASSSAQYNRSSKYSSRSRSRSPPPLPSRDRSKYCESDRGGSSSHRNRRRSPSMEDRYDDRSYSRRGDDRDRDSYRGSSSSSSSKRRY